MSERRINAYFMYRGGEVAAVSPAGDDVVRAGDSQDLPDFDHPPGGQDVVLGRRHIAEGWL